VRAPIIGSARIVPALVPFILLCGLGAMAAPAPAKPPVAPGGAAATPAATVPAATVPAAASSPVHMQPKAWQLSTYSFDGRLESAIGNVTFEAPPDYQKSFAFWTDRMKGTNRTEMIQVLTTTREAEGDAHLPFHRQVARYDLEVNERGGTMEAGSPVTSAVQSMAWEGKFDAWGNVAEIKEVAAPQDRTEIDQLSFPILNGLFPRLEGPRDLRPGETFTEITRIPMPSRLAIRGLESLAIRMTRVFTLREVRGREAVFDVAVSDEIDPATASTDPRTTCVLKGSGKGEAVFNLDDGTFSNGKIPASITIDIEAPLRHLPSQPEGQDPGTAKNHIEMTLTLSGKVTVARLFPDKSIPVPAPAAR
jgi:hypothetical protein